MKTTHYIIRWPQNGKSNGIRLSVCHNTKWLVPGLTRMNPKIANMEDTAYVFKQKFRYSPGTVDMLTADECYDLLEEAGET